MGTTGSGKTVLAKAIMRQLIREIGTGFMFIEGKGDNPMAQEIYAEVVLAKRETDFFFLNFLDKYNSNSINLLETGDFESIRDVLIDFLISGEGSKSDTWMQGAKDLMINALKVLLILRDADLVFDIEKADQINTIEDMKMYRKNISLMRLRELLINPKDLLHFCLAMDRVHENSYEKLVEKLQTYRLKPNETVDNTTFEKIEIHRSLKDTIIQQSNGLGDWSTVQKLGSFEKITKSIQSSQGVFYKLEVSKSFYGEMFTTFFENYSEIFAVEHGDINLEDIITNGKILHVALQGINPSQANSLGKLLLSMIRMFAKKRAKAKPLKVPFMVFADEFNSWSKGISGFADLMSVTRAYGISFIIMYQTDLEKIDEGKGIEAGQIIGNTNTTILLKTQDPKIVKRLNEKLQKVEVAQGDIREKRPTSNDKDTESHRRFTMKERDRIEAEEIANLESGQGYIITSGYVGKMITAYIADNTRFEPNEDADIPLNELYPKKLLDVA